MLPGLEGENIARLEEEVAEVGERGDLGRKPALTQVNHKVYKECSHTSQSYNQLSHKSIIQVNQEDPFNILSRHC